MASALPTTLPDALKEIEKLRKQIKKLQDGDYIDDEDESGHDEKFWKNICEKLKKRDPSYIQKLLQDNELNVNEQDEGGNTLLLMAAAEGNYEVVKLCINLGADVDHENDEGETAAIIAEEEGLFHVEQLLLFESLDAAIGTEVTEYASKVKKQQGIINNLTNIIETKKSKKVVEDTIVDIICHQIQTKQAFSDLLLNFAWNIAAKKASNPLENRLWKVIQQTCKEIIHGKKERDWFWLRNYLLPSTIWLIDLAPPKDDDDDEEEEEEEDEYEEEDEIAGEDGKVSKKKKKKKIKVEFLFYELLKIVQKKADAQIHDLVIPMNRLQEESGEYWEKLIVWDIATKLEDKCRQDAVNGGVKPRFDKEYLTKYARSSATFSVVKHYDHKEYLSQLVLTAHLVDDEYQRSVQHIFDIDPSTNMYTDEKTGDVIRYIRGPVKVMERCQAKAETDYRNDQWPTSAQVLDINRCSLVFDKIDAMLRALKLLENKIKHYESGCIVALCRDKNGFTEYVKNPQYADVKLNVLIATGSDHKHNTNIIGELQFLLRTMMDFKHKAHRLYSITRRKELFDGMGQILPTLLDEKRKLFVAGGLGDIKTIFDLMVTNNKTNKEIMQFDEKSEECILMQICTLGHLKTLKKLKDLLYETKEGKQLFVEGVLHRNDSGVSAFEFVANDGGMEVLQYLCSISDIKKQLIESQDDLYRLFLMATASEYKTNFKYIMNQFSITDELIKDVFFDYAIEEKEDEMGPTKLFPNAIFATTESNDDVDRLKSLLIVGYDRFIAKMLETDYGNLNALERMLQEDNEKMVEFVFSTKQLHNAVINNKDVMFRFLQIAIDQSLWNETLFNKLINEILQISDKTWKLYLYYDKYDESKDAKYLKPDGDSDEDEEEEDEDDEDDEKEDDDDVEFFFDKSLLYRAMQTGNEELTQKFVDILLKGKRKDLMDFLTEEDKNGNCPFMVAMEIENFECAHYALSKVTKKKDREKLLKCCKDIESEEVEEKLKEWQQLL